MVFDIFVFISDLAWENFVKYIRVLIYFDGNFKNDVIITCWRLKLVEASGIWYWKLKTEFVPTSRNRHEWATKVYCRRAEQGAFQEEL